MACASLRTRYRRGPLSAAERGRAATIPSPAGTLTAIKLGSCSFREVGTRKGCPYEKPL
jgi:hypothetical protein